MFFELPALIPLVFYLIRSVSVEVSLNCISRILFNPFRTVIYIPTGLNENY